MNKTPKALVEAASVIFAQKGFQDANVVDICKKAKANIAAINYHFGGKKKLYLEVLAHTGRMADMTYPLIVDAHHIPEPRQRLAHFILAQFLRGACRGSAGHFSRLLVHEMTNPSFAHNHLLRQRIRPMRDYLDTVLREILPSNIPEAYVWACHLNIVSLFNFPMIIGTVHHFKRVKGRPSPPPPEEMARSATLFAFGGIDAIIRAAEQGDTPPALFPPPAFDEESAV